MEEEKDKHNGHHHLHHIREYKNELGIIIVFAPIILFSVLFITFDYYADFTNFEEPHQYFMSLYTNRLIIFSVVTLFWKYLKNIISGYVLLSIFYFFNILIVFSDNVNINQFLTKYENLSTHAYYKNFYVKYCTNLFFLISWSVLLANNIRKWYLVYKQSQNLEVVDENKKDD